MSARSLLRISLLALLSLLSTFTAAAQQAQLRQYLVPLLTRELPGGHGSLWQTQWSVLNPSYNGPVTIFAPTCVSERPCPGTTLPRLTAAAPVLAPRSDGGDGAFVYVPEDTVTRAVMSLRVRDLSQNAQSFGTEIPIVHSSDYTSVNRPVAWLLDVPADPQYRATLRLYGAGSYKETALVQSFRYPSMEPIEEHWIDLMPAGDADDVRPKYPAYAQFDPLTPAARAGGGRIAIAVVAALWNSTISPPPIVPVWAFVSITDNSTQQVTTVTPHE